MKMRAILLMPSSSGADTVELAVAAGIDLDSMVVNDLKLLEKAIEFAPNLLLSFGTGVIVPPEILGLPNLLALNVHAASPQYPGRDPHHFAIYDRAREYGATIHYMTREVDAGPIVDVEMFDVPTGMTPLGLLEHANEAGLKLIARLFRRLRKNEIPGPMAGIAWGARKFTRRMFLDLCRVDCAMPAEEFTRRMSAVEMPGYNNLYIDLHGYRFRLEGQT